RELRERRDVVTGRRVHAAEVRRGSRHGLGGVPERAGADGEDLFELLRGPGVLTLPVPDVAEVLEGARVLGMVFAESARQDLDRRRKRLLCGVVLTEPPLLPPEIGQRRREKRAVFVQSAQDHGLAAPRL